MAELPSPYHGSWIELSGSALRSNLRFLRRLVGRRTEISIASFADMLNHLNYEVLVRLPNELPRVVVD